MSGSAPVRPGAIPLNVVPADWLDRSGDFEARLMRSGLHGTPVVEAPARSALGASNALPVAEIATRLAGADALGERLSALMFERKDSKLVRALRSRFAAPTWPNGQEALAALATLLGRSVHLDRARSVPLEVLSELGPEAAAIAPLVRQRLSAPPAPPDAPAVKRLLEHVDRGVPAFERKKALDALRPPPSIEARLEVGAKSPAVERAGEVGSKTVSVGPSLETVVSALSFGGGRALGLIEDELAHRPESALSERLAAATPPGLPADSAPNRAAALLRLLWQYRDPARAGAVRWDLFEKDTGPAGAELKSHLEAASALTPPSRPNYRFLAETLEQIRLSMPPDAARRLAFELVRRNGLIPTELPALDAVKKTIPDGALAGRGLCSVQHLFPTLVPLVEAFIEKGMDQRCMHILGTPYASHPLVAAYLRVLGVNVMEGTDGGGSTRDFEQRRVEEIGVFLESVIESPHRPERFKLLDDGGLLQLTIAGHKSVPGLDPRALREFFPAETTDAIEQTTRGLTELDKHPLSYRTVTVANAPGKLEEGGIIGWSLADALLHELRQMGLLSAVRNITLVSAGTVGLATARELRDLGFAVTVVDQDRAKIALAEAEGFAVSTDLAETLGSCDLVYACTGKTALDGHAIANWDGLIASGSSAAIEYNRDQINALRKNPIAELNRGRPMNFSGDGHENLSAAQIGLTRALLFIAVTQDTGRGPPERIAVDSRRDKMAVRAWRRSGGHEPPPLSRETPRVASGSRPDAVAGAARHDEWMAYLSSSTGPVCPRPNQVGFVPGLYFFQDEHGKVRSVQTSSEVAASFESALAEVPRRVLSLSEREAPEWLVELPHGGENAVAPAKFEQERLHIGPPRPVRGLLGVFREADRSVHPSWGKMEARSVLYEAADGQLLFNFPGSSQLHSRPRSFEGDAAYLRLANETLVELQKSPPAVSVRGLLGTSVVENQFSNYAVPAAFSRIDAVAPLNDHGDYALIGRSRDGQLALCPLHAGPTGQQVTLLPKDAVFRGMHRPAPDTEPFLYVVDYTLPGDPVELEHLRQEEVRFTWSFWPGSA